MFDYLGGFRRKPLEYFRADQLGTCDTPDVGFHFVGFLEFRFGDHHPDHGAKGDQHSDNVFLKMAEESGGKTESTKDLAIDQD